MRPHGRRAGRWRRRARFDGGGAQAPIECAHSVPYHACMGIPDGGAVLCHVTLATGTTAISERAEVGADTLARLRPLLADLLGGRVEVPRTRDIPLRDAYMVQCVRLAAGAPLFRVYGPKPSRVPPGGADLPCLVSFGVAVVPGAPAFALWDALHAMPDAGAALTDATQPPGAVPWCGVVAHPGLLAAPDAGLWLADFERCVAWTLWEQHHGQRH